MPNKVVIVDDHTLIAEALTGIIEKFADYEVLYESENGKSLMERFQEPANIPDIVLLDINMPVMNGFETAEWLKHNHPSVRIMALSMEDKEDTLIKMIRCGARGYLLKNIHPPELKKALDTILEKGYFYPEWVTHKVLMNISNDKSVSEPPMLNERETEFIQYAASELTYKEIADKMCCSPRTVETYRDNLFEKYGVKSRVGLVIWALKNKLLNL